jgi:Ran GTPase-activating protein (RanGAP) involved in mRNA processing and transport
MDAPNLVVMLKDCLGCSRLQGVDALSFSDPSAERDSMLKDLVSSSAP